MEPVNVVYDICRHYVADQVGVDGSLIAKIGGFCRSRNLPALATCSTHFDRAKHSVVEFRFLRQVEAFFKKNSIFANADICRAAALETFLVAEEQCSKTNVRLRPFVGHHDKLPSGRQLQVRKMARFIQNVLGDFDLFINALPQLVKVTSGATSHTKRKHSLPQRKLKMVGYATRRSAKYVRALYHYFGFEQPRIKVTHANRVEFVPKNWKTDRTIACEPEGNLPLQLAFDTYVKRRLKRFGIDLKDQFCNQKRARLASVNGKDVTVDFKTASDTVAYNAVSLVFPVDWFGFLNDVRSPFFRGEPGEGVYSKFSSMGNGSTFCIETLLFAAACYAVGSTNFLVYGDDVIIEKEVYEEFVDLTGFLGFTVNLEKSYADGPFRESCGGDFFNGIDVTPVYIRSFDRRKATLSHLVNSIGAIAYPGGALQAYLAKLTRSEKLPLVPYSESTIAGVWINEGLARNLGILRTYRSLHRYRAYVAKTVARSFIGRRGYYLWFLRSNAQVAFAGPWVSFRRSEPGVDSQVDSQTSSVDVYDHKYVRKRVFWHLPKEGEPDQLLQWSELLVPRSKAPIKGSRG